MSQMRDFLQGPIVNVNGDVVRLRLCCLSVFRVQVGGFNSRGEVSQVVE